MKCQSNITRGSSITLGDPLINEPLLVDVVTVTSTADTKKTVPVKLKAVGPIVASKVGRKRLVEIEQTKNEHDIARDASLQSLHVTSPGKLWCLCVSHEILLGKLLSVAEWTGGLPAARGVDGSWNQPEDSALWAAPGEGLNLLLSPYTVWNQNGAISDDIWTSAPKIIIDLAFSEVLFCRYVPPGCCKGILMFIFSFGCVCLWDCPSEFREDVISLISPALLQRYQDPDDIIKMTPDDVINGNLGCDEDDLRYTYNEDGQLLQRYTSDHQLLENPFARQMTDPSGQNSEGDGKELYESLVAYSSKVKDLAQKKQKYNAGNIRTGTIKGDTICLINARDRYERVAYSYALAQSCKLTVFEDSIDNSIAITRELPETLAKTGRIEASREEISGKIGELFSTRFYVNLHSDILDTPEFFWEHDEFEASYRTARNYLEIPKRVHILNSRLDIIKDLYNMLNQELLAVNGIKLEWIVIWLVFAEVLIEVVWNIFIRDIMKWV
eukprot:GHVH01013012.1.p1 GENE.GHVH01013012.1~~GHVH01013012.1.p1  ORF type:complete len:498 (-),score=63.50 GHVH01013012.1:170-1663(-)